MAERKLFRPNLSEFRDHSQAKPTRRKSIPPEQTNAENFYYLKQMNSKTAVVVILIDGEELHGWIEWYDKYCIKVNRHDEPNLLVFKHNIKYIFKDE